MKFLNINNNVAFKQVPDGGIEYTGDSIPDLGIFKGDGLDKILSTLINEIVTLRTSEGQPISEKVSELSNKIDNLSTDGLKTSAASFNIGSVTSVSSARILNKEFSYSTEVQGSKFVVSYDMSNTSLNLPKGYKVIAGSLRIQGSGKKSTLVGSTTGTVGSLSINSTAIPANLNFSLKVKTPDGDVELSRVISVQNLTEKTAGGTLTVLDYSSPNSSNLTQKEYNESIASEVSTLKQEMNELKSLSIQSFDSRLKALESNNL